MEEIRDLYMELRSIGLTHDHVSSVLEWVDTLPIQLEGENIHAKIEEGIVKIKQVESE